MKLKDKCCLKDLQLRILKKIVSLTDKLKIWEEGDSSIFEIIDAINEEQDTLIEKLKEGPSGTQMLTTKRKDESNQSQERIIKLLESLVREKDIENDLLKAELKRKSEELKVSKNNIFYNVVEKLSSNSENKGK